MRAETAYNDKVFKIRNTEKKVCQTCNKSIIYKALAIWFAYLDICIGCQGLHIKREKNNQERLSVWLVLIVTFDWLNYGLT